MDLETHTHSMRLLFDHGYGNAACTIAEQFGPGGIAERLLAALDQRNEVDSLKAQLAAATAQRDELRADVRDLTDILHRNGFRRCDAMACNCNSWHHVDGFAARFREIDEAVGEHSGKTLLCAVEEKLADLDQCVRERDALAKSYRETVDQRDELIRRAQLAVWQGLTSEKPHELIPGEPLRAQLIVLGELCGAIARAQSGQPASGGGAS